jgi:hypothetical protein
MEGRVARMGEMHIKFWSENLHSDDLGLDVRRILDCILGK